MLQQGIRRLVQEGDDESIDVQWEINEIITDNNNDTSQIATDAINATAATNSSYVELVALSEKLQDKADSGQLDPGYAVSGMSIIQPEDVCGVRGGNGTTCLDKCGVANGDGTSCITTPAPTPILHDAFDVCENATLDVGASTRQKVLLQSSSTEPSNSSGFFGTFTLTFNEYTTDAISVYASADDIEAKLLNLESVRESGVSVIGLLDNGAVSNTSKLTNGITQLHFGVEFPHSPDRSEFVQNIGRLPLIDLNTVSISGDLASAVVSETCRGAYLAGYEFAEQRVSIVAASESTLEKLSEAGGSITLELHSHGASSCGNGTSGEIEPTAAPNEIADALKQLGEGMFGGIIADGRIEVFQNSTSSQVDWTVRFYTFDAEDLTGCSINGALKLMSAIPSSAFIDAGASVAVEVITSGKVPQSAMPVDLTLIAAEAGASEAAEEFSVAELTVVRPLIEVCGDGIYLTAEGGLVALLQYAQRNLFRL